MHFQPFLNPHRSHLQPSSESNGTSKTRKQYVDTFLSHSLPKVKVVPRGKAKYRGKSYIGRD